jgi:hypothetical protein
VAKIKDSGFVRKQINRAGQRQTLWLDDELIA